MATSDRPIQILLTEGSSSSARQTLYGLAPYTVDILDPSPLCQCRFSRLVRKWYRCPSFSKQPGDYLRYLARRIGQRGYDVLFPTHEQVYLLARYRDILGEHVGLALPSFEALQQMQCKADFARLLDRLELPAPATRIVHCESELAAVRDFPCYVKLSHSTAGYGVKQVHSAQELWAVYRQFLGDCDTEEHAGVVIQQPAHGIQSVVQSVFQHGQLIAAHCSEARMVGIGGGQMIRRSASHPVVLDHLELMGQHLQWHGPLFVDYFYDPQTGDVQYIEANPRIGETVSARICGVNLCELLVRISLGEQVAPVGPTRPDVWSHNGFLLLLAKALQGARRRDVLAECWRMIRGKGVYRWRQNEMMRLSEDWGSGIPALAVTVQLLINPGSADRIVRRTVENYSLPESAIQRIHDLPPDALDQCFQQIQPDVP